MTVGPKHTPIRVLILGGTTEGRQLAEALAGDARFKATVSLAGRTNAPLALPLDVRSGGFGGAPGLEAYLRDNGIGIVIDATHPFAATIKTNASLTCSRLGLPLLSIARPGWRAEPGDRWSNVDSLETALHVIGADPRCIFVTVGRRELDVLEAAPQHIYLIRSVDAPIPALRLPQAHHISTRGPFSFADEIALLRNYGIEWLIAKNSGGEATYAKIEGARRLGLPVAMIERPFIAQSHACLVETVGEALDWLAKQHQTHSATS